MNVRTQFGQIPKSLDQIISIPNRMRTGESDAVQAIDLMNFFQKLHKRTLPLNRRKLLDGVAVDDLPEQRDFLDPLPHQPADFLHNVSNRPRPLQPARIRHNAKCALHVTPLHDADKGRGLPRTHFLVANRVL